LVKVSIRQLLHGRNLPLPCYASPGAAAIDLYAAVESELTINPRTTIAVPTGIAIALPDGYEGQVRPRSGLALDHSIGIINAPGTIDSDYRGEIKVLLTNLSNRDYRVKRGDRIAQMVLAKYEKIEWEVVDELIPTDRGAGRFGHSGK